MRDDVRMTSSRNTRMTAGLVLLALAVIGGVVFAVHPGPLGVDSSIAHWLIDGRTPGLDRVAKALTTVFGPSWMLAAALLIGVALAVHDRSPRRALPVVAAEVAAFAVAEVLKLGVDRPRPPLSLRIGTPDSSASYVSGHVCGLSALVVALLVVVVPSFPRGWAVVSYIAGVALIASCMWTRVYLGMHWPTDVLGALLVGAGSALVVPPLVDQALARLRPRQEARHRAGA